MQTYYKHQDRSNVSELELKENSNYQKAVIFYTAKRNSFLKELGFKYQSQRDRMFNSITNLIEKDLQVEWNKLLSELDPYMETVTRQSKKGNSYQTKILPITEEVKQKIGFYSSLFSGTSRAEIQKSDLGFLYEEFVANYFQNIKSHAEDKFESIRDGKIDELIENFFKQISSSRQTGGIKRSFAGEGMRGFGTDILLDIGFNIQTEEKDGKTYTKRGASPELETKVDLDKVQISKDKTTLLNSILKKYLETGSNNLGVGFSLKNYNISAAGGRNSYTSSAEQQNIINLEFNKTYPKTWNVIYAQAYVNYMVSKNLISLLGPTTLGVMEQSKYLWMDEFVKAFQLTMHVYFQGYAKDNSTEGISPYLQSGNIYLSKKGSISDTSLIKQKAGKDEEYYKMSYQIN